MDAIIRAAAVSAVPRQLNRRQQPAAVPAPVPAPEPAPAPAPAMAAAAPLLPPVQAVVPAPVPPAAPLAAELAANKLLAEARLAHAALDDELTQKRSAADTALAEARRDAEQRGYAAGQAEGEQAAQEQLEGQLERVNGIAKQLLKAKAALSEEAEDDIVELAFAALCRILGEQAATREHLRATVRTCAAGAHEHNPMVIRLHPQDAALLEQDGDAAGDYVRYSADPAVELGGCLVDSATGTLDARLETQLARLRATLLAVRAERRLAKELV